MGKGQPWLTEDEEFLRENYIELSKEELMKRFNTRTWKVIKHKANDMGIKKQNNYEDIPFDELYEIENGIKYKKCKCCRRYLPFEMTYFPKDNACIDGFRHICKECKGENFGLSNAIDWTDKDVKLLKEIYSDMINEDIIKEYFPNRKLKHLTDKAWKLDLKKTKDILQQSRLMSDEGRIKVSNARKSEGYFNGENNPMFGSARFGSLNPNYKGGISNIENELRRNLNQWKIDSMKDCNFKCIFTGERFDHIHHLYSFDSIVIDTLQELNIPIYENISNYTDVELKQIINRCIEIHYRYPLGKCMKEEYHKIFHQNYGYGTNTPSQFDEFLIRFFNGEFDEQLEEEYRSNKILENLKVAN